MTSAFKNPLVYVAGSIVVLQFVTNSVTDLVFGLILVAMLALSSK
jgi:hypothetical protein